MNTRLNVWLVGALAFLAVAPACAGPGGGHGRRFAEPGGMPMFSRPMERPMRPAEFRRDELPMSGRMSPEERRQLRRDIRSAGDDLYRRPPPPPPSPEDR